jgi:hypothetical protein
MKQTVGKLDAESSRGRTCSCLERQLPGPVANSQCRPVAGTCRPAVADCNAAPAGLSICSAVGQHRAVQPRSTACRDT